MFSKLANIVKEAQANLTKKLNFKAAVIATEHFQERMVLRFFEEEYPLLEKSMEAAFKACIKDGNGKTNFRYTHPLYGITIACSKLGSNAVSFISCWKQGKEDFE